MRPRRIMGYLASIFVLTMTSLGSHIQLESLSLIKRADDSPSAPGSSADPLMHLATAAKVVRTAEIKRNTRLARMKRAKENRADEPMIFLRKNYKRTSESDSEYIERMRMSNTQNARNWREKNGNGEKYNERRRLKRLQNREEVNARERLRRSNNRDAVNRRRREYRLRRKLRDKQDAQVSGLEKRASDLPPDSDKQRLTSLVHENVRTDKAKERLAQARSSRQKRIKQAREAPPHDFVDLKRRPLGEMPMTNEEWLTKLRRQNAESHVRQRMRPEVLQKDSQRKRRYYTMHREKIKIRNRQSYQRNKKSKNSQRELEGRIGVDDTTIGDSNAPAGSVICPRVSEDRVDLRRRASDSSSVVSRPSPQRAEEEKDPLMTLAKAAKTAYHSKQKLDARHARERRAREASPNAKMVFLRGATRRSETAGQYLDTIKQRKAQNSVRRQSNEKVRDSDNAKKREYWLLHRDRINENRRLYRAENREAFNAERREYRKRKKIEKQQATKNEDSLQKMTKRSVMDDGRPHGSSSPRVSSAHSSPKSAMTKSDGLSSLAEAAFHVSKIDRQRRARQARRRRAQEGDGNEQMVWIRGGARKEPITKAQYMKKARTDRAAYWSQYIERPGIAEANRQRAKMYYASNKEKVLQYHQARYANRGGGSSGKRQRDLEPITPEKLDPVIDSKDMPLH